MTFIKKIRSTYWLIQAFYKRHGKTILRATVIATILLGLGAFLLQYAPAFHKTNRVGQIGKYTLVNLPGNILQHISVGLVQIDDSGAISQGLADTWTIDSTNKIYRFTLSTTKRWHDSKKLRPEDISYSFKDVTSQIEGNDIVFTLKEPFSPFMNALAKPLLKGKLGVGDYHISHTKIYGGSFQSITIMNDTNKIIYKFYPTENSLLTAYKLGEIDSIYGLSYVPEDIKLEKRNIIQNSTEDSRIAVIFLNNNDSLLQSKSTRQSLAYAINDKSFGHTRAFTPLNDTSWAYNENVKDYAFDKVKANNLFAADNKEIGNIKIELKTILQYLDTAEQIASDWRENLGIQVDVKVVTGITSDYQALLADYAPPMDPDQYSIWHSTQGTNFTHFSNLKVDKLLEDGRRTLDMKLRKDIYIDFQRFLLEDSPAIFLFKTNNFNISRKPIF